MLNMLLMIKELKFSNLLLKTNKKNIIKFKYYKINKNDSIFIFYLTLI
jgi:hypothetical protein